MSISLLKKYNQLVKAFINSSNIDTTSKEYYSLSEMIGLIDKIVESDNKRITKRIDISKVPNSILEFGEWIKSQSRFMGNPGVDLAPCYVSLEGDIGSGKEFIARAIIELNSSRAFYEGGEDLVGREIDNFTFCYWRNPND